MNPLVLFYNNKTQREAVKDFIILTLKDVAVERSFAGQSIDGIKDAKELIDKAFYRLEELYGEKEKPIIRDSK